MNNKFLTPNKIICMVSLFFLLTIDAGFYSSAVMNGTVRLVIAAVAVVFLVITRLQKTIMTNPFFSRLRKTFVFFLLSLVMPLLYGRFNIKQMIIMVAAWSIGYLFTLFVSYQEFKDIFSLLIRFLAVYSLITFAISLIFPDFIYLLPEVVRADGDSFRNAIFSVLSESTYLKRNIGIFWEPGAYSIYLNIALFFELFEEKFNVKRIILYAVTILTTFSTLGIVCMVILFAAFLTTSNKIASSKTKGVILALGSLGLVGLLFFGGDFFFHVFDKLDMSSNNVSDSTTVRINAVIYPLSAFLEKPFLGVGYDDYLFIQTRFCNDMATCTFVNWLCLFGVAGGVLPIIGCIRFFTVNSHKFITNIALFVFTLLLFSTENFIIVTFIYMLVFYGYNKRSDKKLLRKLV